MTLKVTDNKYSRPSWRQLGFLLDITMDMMFRKIFLTFFSRNHGIA